MSEHLPECFASLCECDDTHFKSTDCDFSCICPSLRACEQRIRNQDIATHHADLKKAKALLASRDEAWFAGVEAAREAVAAVEYRPTNPETMIRSMALAAIDALLEEKG